MRKLLPLLAAASLFAASAAQAAPDTRDQFMDTLRAMCGQKFAGVQTYSATPNNDFDGKPISTEVVCTPDAVRMPVKVGADTSRTWIFTQPQGGLELRHDHRHADGTPDKVTMYGGLAKDGGSARSQSFAADDYTAKLVPGAETNLWTVSVSADGQQLIYLLERHAKARAQFTLRRLAN